MIGIKTPLFALLCAGVLVISCKSIKQQITSNPNFQYLSIQKNGCFGECPMYTLELDSEQRLTLTGHRFFQYIGEYQSKFSDESMRRLLSKLKKCNWGVYKKQYLTGYSDLPSTVVRFSNSEGDTSQVIYENDLAPNEVIDVVDLLDTSIQESIWNKVDD